jgi:tetratricopeptide (TPR) repeat protein
MAYAWSKVEYRKLAIKYLKLYLKDELYEKEYKNHQHSFGDKQFSVEEEKNIHLANMYSSLGKAYEREYEFDKALYCYKKGNLDVKGSMKLSDYLDYWFEIYAVPNTAYQTQKRYKTFCECIKTHIGHIHSASPGTLLHEP